MSIDRFDLEEQEREEREFNENKAKKVLGFNPYAIGKQLEVWAKGCAWHGEELERKMKKAGFNLALLIAHLKAMVARLESGKLQPERVADQTDVDAITPILEALLADNKGLRDFRPALQKALLKAYGLGYDLAEEHAEDNLKKALKSGMEVAERQIKEQILSTAADAFKRGADGEATKLRTLATTIKI